MEDGKPTNVRWTVLALACFTSWFLYLHRYTWNFIGPALETEYGFNKAETGSLAAFFNITYGIGQVPSGILSDFMGPHFFLGLIIIVWSLVLPCQGWVTSFPGLATTRLAFGAAQAGAYPSLANVSQAWFPLSSRTIMQSIIATLFGRGGGAMSSIILASVLMDWCGLTWRAGLLVMGGVGALFGIAFLILFRNSPHHDPRVNDAERALIDEGRLPSAAGAPRVLPWHVVLKNRSMYFFVIQQFTSAGADMVYSLFMGDYFLNTKGFSLGKTGLLVSLPLWGGAIGGVLGGFCNDFLIRVTGSRRWSRSAVGFLGKFVACMLMFVVISRESGVAAGWALFAVKFFSDWSQPTVWGACTDLGGRYSATVFSIINTSGTVGGVVAPAIFGAVLDFNSVATMVEGKEKMIANYDALFYLVAALYLVSAACWLFINCTDSLERHGADAKEA
ncbi:putative sulfoacetate transporter SauU [Symmachiella dynata]|uniref:Putative sulfoacetate transporter SauU n=1 Tax=Symmachiella dynata TaxID=2527995 RepID=A0A517ZRM0_9PLAN|nr:MFS transporter [Symmachiella dynata]QDU45120.1 putative sulfoacetate transporter SauU [Symmachiella dynata]